MQIKAILYCGHESPYGLANLWPLLSSKIFDIQEIVLGDFERWMFFRSKLSGKSLVAYPGQEKHFYGKLSDLKSQISKKKNCKIRIEYDVNVESEFKQAANFELVISAAYPQIFKKQLITAPKLGAINFHPSYLPRCRGAHPVYWTIANQEEYGGVSCHFMTEKLDDGPIIARRKIAFDKTSIHHAELYKLINDESPALVKDVESFFVEGKKANPQESNYSYFQNDRDIHRRVYFKTESSSKISAKIRAGAAFAFSMKGHKINLIPPVNVYDSYKEVTNSYHEIIEDGSIVFVNDESLVFKTFDKYIECNYEVNLSKEPLNIIIKKINRYIPLKKDLSFLYRPQVGESLQ
jgi:methionyl-tRNA formyltransferase